MTFSSFIFLVLECSFFGLLVPRKSEQEAQTICRQLFITLFPYYYYYFFFHVFHLTYRKKLHFLCLYISLLSVPVAVGVRLVGSGTRASRRSQLGSGKGGVGRRKTFCCLVALEIAETNSNMS